MTTENQEESFQKIIFPLERDEEGYPPADLESLWGRPLTDNQFQIDNIPFFVRGVSCGDIVAVQGVGKDLYFKKVVQASDHSTVRIIVYDENQTQPLRQSLRDYGCSSELSHLPMLISVDIPPEIELSPRYHAPRGNAVWTLRVPTLRTRPRSRKRRRLIPRTPRRPRLFWTPSARMN